MGVRATVHNGRLVVDADIDLPEGTVLDLVIDDEGDDLDAEERRALEAAIEASLRDVERGEVRPGGEILARLRARRRA